MKRTLIVVVGVIAALVVADRAWAIASGGRGILEQAIFHLKNQSGAVDRTAYSKLADWISVKDYGALGDGLNDDTNAIANAVTASGGTQLLNLPCPGSYITSTYGTLACGIYYPPLGVGGVPRSVPGKLFDSVSVKDFGAKGDGTTNDTTSVQAAITYAQGLGTVGIVRFPCGTYLMDQVTISSSNMIIQGDSRQCSTLKAHSASATGLINLTSGPLTKIIIQELTFDANSTTPTMNTYQSGLAPKNPAINLGTYNASTDVTGLRLENCIISGFDQGLYVPDSGSVGVRGLHNSFVLNNTFTGLSPSTQKDHIAIRFNADNTLVQGNYVSGWTNGINPTTYATTNKVLGNYILQPANGADVGIYASSGANTLIADNYIEMDASTNGTSDGCIKLGGAANPVSSFADVHDNICIRGVIKVSNASDSNIHHNQISSMLNIGCGAAICTTTEAVNARIKISDNIITSPANTAIRSQSTDAVSITGNVIDSPAGIGIWVNGATAGWEIANNRVREPTSTNQCIYVDGASDGVVSGNICKRSQAGGVAIRVGGSSQNVAITGNQVAGYLRGIQGDTGTNHNYNVTGNQITAGTGSTYCLFFDGSTDFSVFNWNNCIGSFSSATWVLWSGQNKCPGAVQGTVALTSATPSTATVSLTSLNCITQCVCTNQTTAANGVKCNVVVGTALTITGPNTVTDSISYLCW